MRGVPGSGGGGGGGGGAADIDRKRSLRFTLETDIVLLQEVGRHKPWASPHGKIRDTWEQIAAAVTATINSTRDESEAARVDHGASKRRYDSLMEAFVKDELKSMRAKGSPDLYVRREELLTDLSLQLSQHHDQKLKVKKQANGVAAAAAAAAGVPSSVITSTATSSSPSPSSMFSGVKHPRAEPSAALPDVKRQAPPRADFDHLDERDVSGNRLKARELDLAERRLELDRARFESEREERSAFVASMQANTTLLMRLIDRLERPGANTISRDI